MSQTTVIGFYNGWPCKKCGHTTEHVKNENGLQCRECGSIGYPRPHSRAHRKAYRERPEVKAREEAYRKAYLQRPEVKARMKAYKKAYSARRRTKRVNL